MEIAQLANSGLHNLTMCDDLDLQLFETQPFEPYRQNPILVVVVFRRTMLLHLVRPNQTKGGIATV